MATADQRIGRYQLLEPIGRGAMGVVYRAEDPLIHRVVAIKILHPAHGLEPQQIMIARERFRREAQAAGSIDHPHIVRIHDVGEDPESGELYIVMEHLAGPSLERLIDEASLDVERSLEIIGQVASALDAAHERDLVHRDVKPSNILLTGRGTAKIVDFGITQTGSSFLTQDISKLGTPAYMSPEQVSGKPVGPRADLFSLGVLSYEILTGQRPFAGVDVVTIAYAIAHGNPVPISVANPRLPDSLDRVFSVMLAKDPADRFASGRAFHEALVRCMNEDAAIRRPAAIDRVRRGHRALWVFAGFAVLIAGALAMFVGAPRRNSAQPPAAATAAGPPSASTVKPARSASTAKAAPTTSTAKAAPKAVPKASAANAAPAVAETQPPPPPAVVPKATTEATISLVHRIRGGTLSVSLDGIAVFSEAFSKEKLAIQQTTTWDPLKVPAGKHTLQAKVTGVNGATYLSGPTTVDLPPSRGATIRIKIKGDRLIVEPS